MKESINCINLIKKWENLSLIPYQDTKGVWTIGYGHTKGVTQYSTPITESGAVGLLKQDIAEARSSVNSIFAYKSLRQCQYDALVSLIFNIGSGNFGRSNLIHVILSDKDSKYIADEWVEFRNGGGIYARGLLRRRLEELTLYYSW